MSDSATQVGLRLEGHERLCEERNRHIDTKITGLEDRLDETKEDLSDAIGGVKGQVDKVLWTVLVGMASILATEILEKVF